MAVILERLQRKNPIKKEESDKWYVAVKSLQQVEDREVAKLVADETTLNANEVEFVLNQYKKVLLNLLRAGYTVKMGDWASFFLTVNSAGTATREEAGPHSVKKINVNCRFDKKFKFDLSETEFIMADKFADNKKTDEGTASASADK